MPLSSKARHAADEIEQAIAEANTRRVVELVDEWGLSAGDRIGVAEELDRRVRIPVAEDVVLSFDRWDRARTVSDVWAHG